MTKHKPDTCTYEKDGVRDITCRTCMGITGNIIHTNTPSGSRYYWDITCDGQTTTATYNLRT